MVDAADSKSAARKGVRVRLPPPAPRFRGLNAADGRVPEHKPADRRSQQSMLPEDSTPPHRWHGDTRGLCARPTPSSGTTSCTHSPSNVSSFSLLRECGLCAVRAAPSPRRRIAVSRLSIPPEGSTPPHRRHGDFPLPAGTGTLQWRPLFFSRDDSATRRESDRTICGNHARTS